MTHPGLWQNGNSPWCHDTSPIPAQLRVLVGVGHVCEAFVLLIFANTSEAFPPAPATSDVHSQRSWKPAFDV